MGNLRLVCIRAVLIVAAVSPGFSQSNPDLQTFFKEDIGLSQDQIAAIRSGQAVAKTMPSRTPAEVFLFGAIYIHASPESYVKFAHDFDRLRKLPNYLALGIFSNPPQLSDLKDFSFDDNDIKGLKNCKLGDCLIQMPASSIEELQRSINWSAGDVNDQVNQRLRETVLQRLLAYQRAVRWPMPLPKSSSTRATTSRPRSTSLSVSAESARNSPASISSWPWAPSRQV